MKKRGLLVLVGMMVLVVISCCAMTAAFADGDQNQVLPMELSGYDENDEYWVNQTSVRINITAKDAKELDVKITAEDGSVVNRIHVPYDPSIGGDYYDWN